MGLGVLVGVLTGNVFAEGLLSLSECVYVGEGGGGLSTFSCLFTRTRNARWIPGPIAESRVKKK